MILLVILAAAVILFSMEKIPADVVALGVMLALILTGLLTPEEAFLGFGSDTVLMILGLLILTAALTRTGVVELTGRAILQRTSTDPNRLMVVISSAVAALSSLMSNTAATAFFLPVTIGLAKRSKISPSRLLMPLAFASILASSVTLISTSTNIVVSGLISQHGMAPISMFEMTPVGIPIALVGLVYMFTIGKRLVPNRADPEDLTERFGLRAYLTEVLLPNDSPLAGHTLEEARLGQDLDLTVVRVIRDKTRYLAPDASLCLAAGDVLLVEGSLEDILKIKDITGIDIKADVKLADPDVPVDDMELVEAVLLPRSPLIGRTLKRSSFRQRYGLQVLAINRGNETIRKKISQVPLRLGDVLLIQGPAERIHFFQEDRSNQILGVVEDRRPNLKRAPVAIAIFVAALLLATFNIVSLPVAMLLGALGAFVSGCITPEEAYRDVEWKALILIGSMLALGAAMNVTGAAAFLAAHIVGWFGGANPLWLLGAFFALTVLLTQPMSNQTAAAVVVPIAVQTAVQLGLNPRTFAMMIAVAASCSYLTPLEPSCLMVYGPGHYRFMDFLRVGALLTLITFAIALVLVPLVWPL